MPSQEEEFQGLLARLRAGSPEAAREFDERYGDLLLRVIRRRLDTGLRSRFDSIDFRQDVYASFFRDLPEEHAFPNSKALISYLAKIARNKVFSAFRQNNGPKRRPREPVRSLDGSARIEALRQVGPEPTASKVFLANEQVATLTRGKPARYKQIVELARLGFSHVEIARKLDLHVKVVRRALVDLDKKVSR